MGLDEPVFKRLSSWELQRLCCFLTGDSVLCGSTSGCQRSGLTFVLVSSLVKFCEFLRRFWGGLWFLAHSEVGLKGLGPHISSVCLGLYGRVSGIQPASPEWAERSLAPSCHSRFRQIYHPIKQSTISKSTKSSSRLPLRPPLNL